MYFTAIFVGNDFLQGYQSYQQAYFYYPVRDVFKVNDAIYLKTGYALYKRDDQQ